MVGLPNVLTSLEQSQLSQSLVRLSSFKFLRVWPSFLVISIFNFSLGATQEGNLADGRREKKNKIEPYWEVFQDPNWPLRPSEERAADCRSWIRWAVGMGACDRNSNELPNVQTTSTLAFDLQSFRLEWPSPHHLVTISYDKWAPLLGPLAHQGPWRLNGPSVTSCIWLLIFIVPSRTWRYW